MVIPKEQGNRKNESSGESESLAGKNLYKLGDKAIKAKPPKDTDPKDGKKKKKEVQVAPKTNTKLVRFYMKREFRSKRGHPENRDH